MNLPTRAALVRRLNVLHARIAFLTRAIAKSQHAWTRAKLTTTRTRLEGQRDILETLADDLVL